MGQWPHLPIWDHVAVNVKMRDTYAPPELLLYLILMILKIHSICPICEISGMLKNSTFAAFNKVFYYYVSCPKDLISSKFVVPWVNCMSISEAAEEVNCAHAGVRSWNKTSAALGRQAVERCVSQVPRSASGQGRASYPLTSALTSFPPFFPSWFIQIRGLCHWLP